MGELIFQLDGMILFGVLIFILFIAIFFYLKYDLFRLKGLGRALDLICAKGSTLLPSGQKQLIEFLLSRARGSGNQVLLTAWEDYYNDYITLLHGEMVPDVDAYFNEDKLITVPCSRRLMERFWHALLFLGMAGALLSPALTLLGQKTALTAEILGRSLGLSAFYLAAVFLVVFIFRLADAVVLEGARRSLWNFQYQINEWLNPVTGATMISVLVESQQQQAKVFREAVAELGNRLDHFETKSLAPVLGGLFQDVIEQKLTPVLKESSDILNRLTAGVLERQENGMQELARTFTEQLTAISAEKLTGFAEKAGEVSQTLTGIVTGMEQILEGMDKTKEFQETAGMETRAALAEAGRIQSEISQALQASLTGVAQAGTIASELRGYAVKGLEKAEAMARQSQQFLESNLSQVKAMQGGLSKLSENLEQNIDAAIGRVAGKLDQTLKEFTDLSAGLEASREKHSAELEAKFEKLVGGLDQSLAGYSEKLTAESQTAAENYRNSLQEVLGSNTQTIDKLTAATAEVSLTGSRILEQVNQHAGQLYSDLAGKVEVIYGDLAGKVEAIYGDLTGKVETMQEGIGVLAGNLAQNTDTVISRVGGELDRVFGEYEKLSAGLEATRMKQSAELVFRLDQLVNGLDKSLAEHGERLKADSLASADKFQESLQEVLVSNSQTAEKLADAASEVSVAGGRILEQVNQHAGRLYSDLAERIETIYGDLSEKVNTMQELMGVLAGDLTQNSNSVISRVAVELDRMLGEYQQLSAGLEASRTKQSVELASRLETIVGGLDRSLAEHGERLKADSIASTEEFHNSLQEVLVSNSQTAEKLADAASEVSLAGGRILEQVNQHAGRLYSDLAEKVESIYGDLAGKIETTQEGIGVLAGNLAQNTDSVISRVGGELDRVFGEYEQLNTVLEASREKQSAELLSRLKQLVVGFDRSLAEHGERLKAESLASAEKFQNSLQEVLGSNARTAEKLAEASTEVSLAGGQILDQTNQRAAQLYSDLAGRMDKSINDLGENMAAGMRKAMADSMEIVAKLTVTTDAMKEMYDSYFTRAGEQSTKMLDEMDFNIQKIFATFTTETEQIISRLTDNSTNALDFFDKGIRDLVGYMDEHSRSIGLYAKEINFDVADLSGNLRESVKEFSSQIEAGISQTFEDFDKGLGEVTLRLANILESIRDSVEALQKVVVRQ